MRIAKVTIASLALCCSGWCLYDARATSQAFQPSARHRSAQDELRRMQERPEEALVLWIPGEVASTEVSRPEATPPASPTRKLAKATAWRMGKMPNPAEAH